MKYRFVIAMLCSLMAAAGYSLPVTPQWGDLGDGTFRNPVLNADFSDPDVIRVGDRYFMVASDFHFMGMQMLESDDLVNWRYVSQIYDRLPFAEYDDMQRYGGGSWAPALRYHEGRYYVYFCTPHEGLFMTSAERPEGPWSDLLLVKAVEKWEDPCPFWDEDGQAYLGHSLYGAGPIIMHRMSPDGTRLLDEGVTVYEGPVAEGTKIHRIGDWYYLSIPEGGVRGGWQTILRSKSLYGPYERRIVLEQGTTDINGPHQGAIVDTPDGQWWFYHFQETDAQGRVVHLQPMTWDADGWPRIGVDYDGNGIGEPVSVWSTRSHSNSKPSSTGFQPVSHQPMSHQPVSHQPVSHQPVSHQPVYNQPAYHLAATDDFSAPTLGLQWQWCHNPVDSAWSLTERHGALTLHALHAPDFKHARNTLTQKAVGDRGNVTTALQPEYMSDGQRAGLACMGKYNHMAGVKMEGDKRFLYFGTDTSEIVICEIPPSLGPVFLRLNLDFPTKTFVYEYSLDGYEYLPLGKPFYTRWGNWKGVRPALYSYNVKAARGAADFLWFDYQHDGNNSSLPQSPLYDHEAEQRIVDNIALTSFADRVIAVSSTDWREGHPHLDKESSHPVSPSHRSLLQHAIDSCSLLGGGRVVVAPGTYHIDGNIVLRSNVNLHLSDVALLLFSGRGDDFLPVVLSRWEGTDLYGRSPMIYACHAENIAITGRGVIDAQAGVEMGVWGEREIPDRDRLRTQGEDLVPVSERVYADGTVLRPTCIEFLGCSRILIEGVTIKNSPFWTIHPVYCDNVVVRGVNIDSHFPNNDGCDPDSSSNVLIEDCTFNVGDDAIAIKAGRDADGRAVGRPSENIVIRNCRFNSECNGLCIGSELSGGVSRVYMHDIQIGTVKNAIYFKSNRDRGGYIRDVYVSDITVKHTLGAVLRFETNYFGFRGGRHATQYEDFHIRNVVADRSDRYALFISGYPEKPVRDVWVTNMTVHSAPMGCYTHCTESLHLDNVTVNGELLPTTLIDDPDELTLDIY